MSAHPEKVDILIAGAGILGTATAYHLAHQNPKLRMAWIDVDPEGRYSSSQRNAGGVRAFWDSEINRQLSFESIAFFREHKNEIGFNTCGYVWLHGKRRPLDPKLIQIFSRTPYPITVYDAHDQIPYLPWKFKRDDLQCITFHPEAGILNPHALRSLLFEKTKQTLADRLSHLPGACITGLEKAASSWKVFLGQGPSSETELLRFYESPITRHGSAQTSIQAQKVVIALGAWSPPLLAPWRTISYTCQPIARHIAFVDAPAAYAPNLPMVVDASGVYFHPEGGHLLVGYADPAQKPGYNFSYSEESFFESLVWPKLYERSEVFASCKHRYGWAGMYSYTPDQNGILGDVIGQPGLYQIHGFTGRGVMVSTAAGRGLAEYMLTGKFQTLDLSSLSESRFKNPVALKPLETHHI